MKIIGTADVHAHNYKEFDKRTTQSGSRRLDYILDSLRLMKRFALDNNIEVMTISGDLFHVRNGINTVVYNGVYDTITDIAEAGITLIMIPGNHDDSSAIDLSPHSLHSFKHINNVIVLDEIFQTYEHTDIKGEKVTFVGLRYTKDAKLVIQKAKELVLPTDNNILLAHLGIAGGQMASGHSMPEGYNISDLRPELFKFMAFGHFHKRQLLGANAFYCGSLLQHDFGESGQVKGFTVMDTDTREIDFVESETPEFFNIELGYVGDKLVSLDVGDPDVTVDKVLDALGHGHYFRFKVPENGLKDLRKVLDQLPDLMYKLEIVKEYKAEERVDVRIGMPFEEIVTKYADEFNPEAKQEGIDILREVRGI